MKTFYEVNGRRFESKDEAIKYEERLEKTRIEKEKLEKEKQSKLEQINAKEKELKKLKDSFCEEYGELYSTIDSFHFIPHKTYQDIFDTDLNYFPLDMFGNFRTY